MSRPINQIEQLRKEFERFLAEAPEEQKGFWKMLIFTLKEWENSRTQRDLLRYLARFILDAELGGYRDQARKLKDLLVNLSANELA